MSMLLKSKNTGRRGGAEYRFKIDAYSPDTMPMSRLAQYMAELADLLGEQTAVHFKRITKGSTVLNATVDREAEPKVRDRVSSVRAGDATAAPIGLMARSTSSLETTTLLVTGPH